VAANDAELANWQAGKLANWLTGQFANWPTVAPMPAANYAWVAL